MSFTVPVPQINPMVQLLSQRAQGFFDTDWSIETKTPETRANTTAQPNQTVAGEMAAWQQDPRATGSTGSSKLNDKYSAMGFNDNVPRSLIGTESGGNWGATNDEVGSGGVRGHDGILQFGAARLDDAKRAGVVPAGMTREQFKASKSAQIAAANWHFDDIDKRARKAGYDKLIGQDIGGVPISWNGMRSMAHLGGFGGLSQFISTGGKYNPADSFGTSLKKYGRTHAS